MTDKWLGSWKQVEKPTVKRSAQVKVLIPVSCESLGVVWSVHLGSHSRVIITRTRKRIERPRQPVSHEDGTQRDQMDAK